MPDHNHRCLTCGRTWRCPGDCQTAGSRCLSCGTLLPDWERHGESVDFRHQHTEKGAPMGQESEDPRIWEAIQRVVKAAGYERAWVTPTGEAHLFLERNHPTKTHFIQVAPLERLVDDRSRRPEVVCLCGSTRFMEAFAFHYGRLTDEGKIVLSVGRVVPQSEQALGSERKKMLDELHKRKIDLCDRIFVLNVGGYIGSSTRSEIEYAERIGREVQYLEPIPVRQAP